MQGRKVGRPLLHEAQTSHEPKIVPADKDGRTLSEQTDIQMPESFISNDEFI